MAKLAAGSIDAGAKIIHDVTVEDLIVRENSLGSSVLVRSGALIPLVNLHVDTLFICSQVV